MIRRELEQALREAAGKQPVVAVTGPRQSGKTTLVRNVFPDHDYVLLEDPDLRAFATQDPRRFLARYRAPVIIDEIQRVPELTSYLQGIVDSDESPGRYVITGSSNLMLLEQVSQSLAGRVSLLTLLPLSGLELWPVEAPSSLEQMLWGGFFPRVHARALDPSRWYRDYVTTYLERDVRNTLKVSNLEQFHLFLRMCAARSGQLLNLTSLGNDCGITHNTARSWLSVLQASYIVHLLEPHHANMGKRLVKAPKLHFLDSGLLCHLLEIDRPEELITHSARGAVFEGWVVSELLKSLLNRDLPPRVRFWRDYAGHEVDVLLGGGSRLTPVEVKSGATVAPDFFKGLVFWARLADTKPEDGWVVFGGDDDQDRATGHVLSWRSVGRLTSMR